MLLVSVRQLTPQHYHILGTDDNVFDLLFEDWVCQIRWLRSIFFLPYEGAISHRLRKKIDSRELLSPEHVLVCAVGLLVLLMVLVMNMCMLC
jgi:hypothetical protein